VCVRHVLSSGVAHVADVAGIHARALALGYGHGTRSHIRAEILRSRAIAPTPPCAARPAAQRTSASSQRLRIDALNDELQRLREDNANLRSQLERSLGERRSMKAANGPMATISSVRDMSLTQTT